MKFKLTLREKDRDQKTPSSMFQTGDGTYTDDELVLNCETTTDSESFLVLNWAAMTLARSGYAPMSEIESQAHTAGLEATIRPMTRTEHMQAEPPADGADAFAEHKAEHDKAIEQLRDDLPRNVAETVSSLTGEVPDYVMIQGFDVWVRPDLEEWTYNAVQVPAVREV